MKFLRRPEPWVFVILLTSYAYFWQARDWNLASRLMLTYALVDRGTLSIDGLEDQTRDLALYQGHYYSDKTPGFSLMAIPPYLLVKQGFRFPAHPLNQAGFRYWVADYWITLATSGVLSAFTGVILVGLARDLGCSAGRSAFVGLSYGLATPAFAYATLAYGHQMAAFALLAGFAILWRDGPRPRLRAMVAGLLISYASVVEIQVGPVSAILGIYLLALAMGKKRPLSTVLVFGAAAAIPALILLFYNQLAFGSPWRMGYFYEVLDRFKDVHSSDNPLGIRAPDWSKLGDLIWGERRGLIWFAPILILAIPGLVALSIRRLPGLATVVTLTILAVILVNLCYPEWTGGWTTGPRLLVPLLPFAMLPIAALLASAGGKTMSLAVVLALVGGVIILGFVAVGARVPDGLDRPLIDGVWPLWRGVRPLPGWVFGNRYARNLANLAFPGSFKQLPAWAGWVILLPLITVQVSLIALMTRFIGQPPDQAILKKRKPESS